MSAPPVHRLFTLLLAAYGAQRWWPARSAFAMMAGAVLVQNTAWTGAALAVRRLEEAGALHPAALRALEETWLWELIRPAGYFRVKAKRLRALAEFLQGHGDDPERLFQQELGALRRALLGVHGIGQETADSILCYGAAQPIFVVDAYTRRLFHRLGWSSPQASYETLQSMVHHAMPPDAGPAAAEEFAEFHALIVRHAKRHCRARPLCIGCPVTFCPMHRP
ncbi:MAG: endonuclease [Magnetococcales bacterium]|nr:endonuclease [Magnetococcales bacterium]